MNPLVFDWRDVPGVSVADGPMKPRTTPLGALVVGVLTVSSLPVFAGEVSVPEK